MTRGRRSVGGVKVGALAFSWSVTGAAVGADEGRAGMGLRLTDGGGLAEMVSVIMRVWDSPSAGMAEIGAGGGVGLRRAASGIAVGAVG